MLMFRVEQTTPQRPVNLLNGATYGVRTVEQYRLTAKRLDQQAKLKKAQTGLAKAEEKLRIASAAPK